MYPHILHLAELFSALVILSSNGRTAFEEWFSKNFPALANLNELFGYSVQGAMSSVAGLPRKRSREDSVGIDHSQMAKKATSAMEIENGVAREETERQKMDLYITVPGPEIPSELSLGWDGIAELPYLPTLEDDILLGWFPFVDDDFTGLCSQTEVVWDDDLWQIKHINEIPN